MNELTLKNTTIESEFNRNNYDGLSKLIQENIEDLKSLLVNYDFEKAYKEIDNSKTQLSYLVKKEVSNHSISFILGGYIGFIDATSEYIRRELKKESVIRNMNSYNISEIPHINDIISSIFKEPGIRHGKLAEKVGIEKSTLTGIMDKLVEKGIVIYSRPGKYKYYYLSELGMKYYKDNHKVIEGEMDIKYLTEQLMITLSKKNENVSDSILEIISSLINGKTHQQGYKSNTMNYINLYELFAGLPRIHPLNIRFLNEKIYEINNALVVTSNIPLFPSIISFQCNNDNEINNNNNIQLDFLDKIVSGGV